MGKKYVCSKCKEKTDNPNQFILEQGVCRKCYMKDYYKNHPRKNAPKVAPENKKPSVEEALIPAEELEELMAGVDFLDIPIMDLTLREVVQVGGEVRITEKPHVSGIGLATATNSLKVELDFSKYPELHAKLCEMATEDFRVVSMEIMALLDHMVGGSNE